MHMDKGLTHQAIKKLQNMTEDDKVRLLARLVIMRQNSQISGFLSRIIGTSGLGLVKSEIVHELYDGNGKYPHRFNHLLNILSSQNPYDGFDTYTLCAYCLYFSTFLNSVRGAVRYSEIVDAYKYSADITLENVDRGLLNVDAVHKRSGALTQKDYRKYIVNYLLNDFNCKDIFGLLNRYVMGEELNQNDVLVQAQNDVIYANQVEQYKDENGKVYYLDVDGNLVDYNEIKDFRSNNILMRATKHGVVTYNNQQSLEK